MIVIATVEADILQLLRAAFPVLEVEPFPDEPEKWVQRHRIASLLVGYVGSRYGSPEDVALMIQRREARFDITIKARAMNGPTGATSLVDQVRQALAGRTAGGGKLRPTADKFVGRIGATWEYAVGFAIPLMAIEDAEFTADPLLTRIDIIDALGQADGGVSTSTEAA